MCMASIVLDQGDCLSMEIPAQSHGFIIYITVFDFAGLLRIHQFDNSIPIYKSRYSSCSLSQHNEAQAKIGIDV